MKKAFTLLELMITVAVMVVLMGVVFMISGIGGDAWRRTATISRLQRLENCLSGYYAAFGTYPPVKLHGTRDIYRRVNVHGLQGDQENSGIWNWSKVGEAAERQAWNQVRAACKAQPVDCRFPFPDGYNELVEIVSEEMKSRASSSDAEYEAYRQDGVRERLLAGFDDGVTRNINRHADNKNMTSWRDIQLFKFGLMSYLLPRYLVMMNGPADLFSEYAQWTENNQMPSSPMDGKSYGLQGGWELVRELSMGRASARSQAEIACLPTQSVCARWIPNLQGICQVNHATSVFGVSIHDTIWSGSELNPDNVNIEIFSPSGADSDSTAMQYILDGVTVRDGWGNEFYYYSPAPYQHYTLWSAGPNGRTFPPWINRENIKGGSKARECIALWTVDDIMQMSN